ncbi:hypothetical protein [Streptosporangium vulgare]|uniref:Uncharacterized protein n=1 Tax=Streptosporangium vulgare TaxID=46190 RepID=A0ABV5TVB1_9ACTN
MARPDAGGLRQPIAPAIYGKEPKSAIATASTRRIERILNEELVAGLMSSFGMKFLGLRHGTGIPTFVAGRVTSCGQEEGRRDRIVKLDDPNLISKFNSDWHEMATEFGLFSVDRRFLVSLSPAIDPVFDQAREETDDWEAPSWWESVWGLVELLNDWDLAGAGAASRVLGAGYGHPSFAMSAMDGSVFVVGTVWQDSIGTAALPTPYCSPTLRDSARKSLGSRTAAENEDLKAWLARGKECAQ